jgi:predicted transcriptional regulator
VFTIDELKEFEVVTYNEVKYEYNLTDKGERLIYILSKALTNKGIPKI